MAAVEAIDGDTLLLPVFRGELTAAVLDEKSVDAAREAVLKAFKGRA
jgi:hypothetical protein